MKRKEVAVKLHEVTKTYFVEKYKPTFVEHFFSTGKAEKFVAIDNLSTTFYKGEKIGILGLNGAGKTTLLKIITEITKPDTGLVKTQGKIVSLINLYAGFHPELSGIENITLNGLLIGMSAKEIEKNLQKIITFADIGDFIYAPMHTYSSGMRLRLGFSIAVYSNPDILVLDEGISAGDEKFHKKAHKAISTLFSKDKTIIVVSHWMSFLRENCKRMIWMEKGKIKMDGAKEVIEAYIDYYNKTNH